MVCQICKKVDCIYGRITATYKTWHQVKREREARAVRKLFFWTQLLFLATLAMFVLSGCKLAPVTVTVQPDVPGDHNAIEWEVRAGLEFFCQQKKIDNCDYWASGLEIDVRGGPERRWKDGKPYNVYGIMDFVADDIWVVWLEGIHKNAYFHELLHRYNRHGNHGADFAAEWNQMQLDWALQGGL